MLYASGSRSLLVGFLLACSAPTQAVPALDIFQLAGFVNAPELGAESLEDTRIGSGASELAGAGFDVTFSNNLGSDNLGTVTWSLTNTTGIDLTDVRVFGFLDAEIVEPGNTFFNESGALVTVPGTGAADPAPDSWEIDEPGFLFGDIFEHLLAGTLDNFNNVPAGLEDDVSLALGFAVGSWMIGDSLLATFTISDRNIGGLSHTDAAAGLTFFFNGTLDVIAAPTKVPEPGTLALMSAWLLAWQARRRLGGGSVGRQR